MGQYWVVVNLDKCEFVSPHKLGCGLKLGEQLGVGHGTGAALIVLLAAGAKTPRGGGDLDVNENWHGPERKFPEHNITPGTMPQEYPKIAERTIGRWAGDRVVLVGDYAEDGDLPVEFKASELYGKCFGNHSTYRDVSDDVACVIEHELCGTFKGDGWRQWQEE